MTSGERSTTPYDGINRDRPVCPYCGLTPHAWAWLERFVAAGLDGWFAALTFVTHAH